MLHTTRRPLALGTVLAGVLLLTISPAAFAADADAFPRTAAAAMDYYEGRVDDWLDGPVLYIALQQEIDAFKRLDDTAARQAFIDWFWARRDNDLRTDDNPCRQRFYERVAQANTRYHGFPRGWRSDRGLLNIVLGRPDAVRPNMGQVIDTQVWTYYTVGPRADFQSFDSSIGELSVAFIRTRYRSGYQIYGGFGGPGVLPRYVAEILDITNQASIADPALPRTAVP